MESTDAELLKVFTASRGKDHRVNFNWLWSKARNEEGCGDTFYKEIPLKVPQSTTKKKEV